MIILATMHGPQSINQINWGGNDDPNGLLEIGVAYEVAKIEVHSYHTKLHLKVFPGKVFNSTGFVTTPPDAVDMAIHLSRQNS